MSRPSQSPMLEDLMQSLKNLNATSFATDEDRQDFLITVRSLSQRLEKPMETLLRIAWIEPAYAACLKIGVDIGLFAALGKSNTGITYTIEELAHLTNTDSNLLGKAAVQPSSAGRG